MAYETLVCFSVLICFPVHLFQVYVGKVLVEQMTMFCQVDNWNELTKKEKLVLLCKDGLDLIRQNKAIPCNNVLLRVTGLIKTDQDAREYLLDKCCQVCAKGIVLLSRILGRNEYLLSQLGLVVGGIDDSTPLLGNTLPEVDQLTLDAMEVAFEGRIMQWTNLSLCESINWVGQFDTRERLICILTRCIENGGTFTQFDIDNPPTV